MVRRCDAVLKLCGSRERAEDFLVDIDLWVWSREFIKVGVKPSLVLCPPCRMAPGAEPLARSPSPTLGSESRDVHPFGG